MPVKFKSFKIIAIVLCFLLCFEQCGFAQAAAQIDISSHLTSLSHSLSLNQNKYRPLHLRYLRYDSKNNDFNLLLDKGDFVKEVNSPALRDPAFYHISEERDRQKLVDSEKDKITVGTGRDLSVIKETKKLMEYFLIGLSLPNESFWVNLRPDSPDNVIDSELAKTDIGKILLEADVQLKKDTAVYTSPQTNEGRKYWNKLYKKAEELYGYDNITIPTLTRPWIIPGEIIISEANDTAYIYKASLKVMLEEDYLRREQRTDNREQKKPVGAAIVSARNQYEFKDPRLKELNTYSTQLIKELILPKLTQEVNTSKKYASLRQVYYSLILAQWFKQRQTQSHLVGGLGINSGNLSGLTSRQAWSKQAYYQQYQTSFKDGEYNLREPVNTPYGKTVRSYMSGGAGLMNCVPPLGQLSQGLNEIPTSTGERFACIKSSAITQEEDRGTKDYLIRARVAGNVNGNNNIGNVEIVSSGIEKEENKVQIQDEQILASISPDNEISNNQVAKKPTLGKKIQSGFKTGVKNTKETWQALKAKFRGKKELSSAENEIKAETLAPSLENSPEEKLEKETQRSNPNLRSEQMDETINTIPRAVIADVGIKIEAIANRLALEKFNRNMQEGGYFRRLWRRGIYYRWARPALLKKYAGEFEKAMYELINNGTAIDNTAFPELGNEFSRKGISSNSAESFLTNLDNIVERIDEQQKLGAFSADVFDSRETPMNRVFPSIKTQKSIDKIKDLVCEYIQSGTMSDENFNSRLRPILADIRDEINVKVLGSNFLAKAKELRHAYLAGEIGDIAGIITKDSLPLDITFATAQEADVRVRKVEGRINRAVTKVINKTQSIPVARWFTSPMVLGLAAFLGANKLIALSAGALSGLIAPALAIAIPIGIWAGMRQIAEVNQNYQQVDLRQSLGLTTAGATKLEQKLNAAVVDKLDVQKTVNDLASHLNKTEVITLIGEILARITQGREIGIELFKYAPDIDEEIQKVNLLRQVNFLIGNLNFTPSEIEKARQDAIIGLQQKINSSNKNFRKRKSLEAMQAVAISAGTAIAFSYLIGWLFRGWMGMGSQPASNAAGTTASANKEVTYTLQEFLAKNSNKLNAEGLRSALQQAGISNPDKITADLLSGGKVSVQKLISYLNSYSAGNQKLAAVLEQYIEGIYGIDIQFTNSSNFLQALWQAPGLKEQLQQKGIKDFSKFASAFEKEMGNTAKGSWSLFDTLKGILGSNRLAKNAEVVISQAIERNPVLNSNFNVVLNESGFLNSQGAIQSLVKGNGEIASTLQRYTRYVVDSVSYRKFVSEAVKIYQSAASNPNTNWAETGSQLRALLGNLHPADRVNIAFDWVHRFSGWNVKAVTGTATNAFQRIFFNITRAAQPIKITEAAEAVEEVAAETVKALNYFLGPFLSGAPYKGLGLLSFLEGINREQSPRDNGDLKNESEEHTGDVNGEGAGDIQHNEGDADVSLGTGEQGEGAKSDGNLSVPGDLEQGQDGRLEDSNGDLQDLQAARDTLAVLQPELIQAQEILKATQEKLARIERQAENLAKKSDMRQRLLNKTREAYLKQKRLYPNNEPHKEGRAYATAQKNANKAIDEYQKNQLVLTEASESVAEARKLITPLQNKYDSLSVQIAELEQRAKIDSSEETRKGDEQGAITNREENPEQINTGNLNIDLITNLLWILTYFDLDIAERMKDSQKREGLKELYVESCEQRGLKKYRRVDGSDYFVLSDVEKLKQFFRLQGGLLTKKGLFGVGINKDDLLKLVKDVDVLTFILAVNNKNGNSYLLSYGEKGRIILCQGTESYSFVDYRDPQALNKVLGGYEIFLIERLPEEMGVDEPDSLQLLQQEKIRYSPPPAELEPVEISPEPEIIDITLFPESPVPQSQAPVSQVSQVTSIDLTREQQIKESRAKNAAEGWSVSEEVKEVATKLDIPVKQRHVVIGDVHGRFDTGLKQALRDAGLLSAEDEWIGGEDVLVQLGDVIDRGQQSLEADTFIRENQKTGVKIIRLFGNHELRFIRGMMGDNIELIMWATSDNFGRKIAISAGIDFDLLDKKGYKGNDPIILQIRNNHRLQELLRDISEDIQTGRIQAVYEQGDWLFAHAGIESCFSKGRSLSEIREDMNSRLKKAVKENDFTDEIFNSTANKADGIFWTYAEDAERFDKGLKQITAHRGMGIRKFFDGLISVDVSGVDKQTGYLVMEENNLRGYQIERIKAPAVSPQPISTPPIIPLSAAPSQPAPQSQPLSPQAPQTPVVAPSNAPERSEEDIKQQIQQAKEEIITKAGTRSVEDVQGLIASVKQILVAERDTGENNLAGCNNLQEILAIYEGKERFFVDRGIACILDRDGKLIVVGDTHGDSKATEAVLLQTEFIKRVIQGEKVYLSFLGDYVDRGRNEIRNLEMVLALKQKFPKNVVLLRGNHEEGGGYEPYNLPKTLIKKYGNENGKAVHQSYVSLFDLFPNVVITANGIVNVHGGIPNKDIKGLQGLFGEDQSQIFYQMRWSDPYDQESFVLAHQIPGNPTRSKSGRDEEAGGVTLFCGAAFKQFMQAIGGKVMVRGHEVVYDYKESLFYNGKLVTIFSTGEGSIEAKYNGQASFAIFDLSKSIYEIKTEDIIPVKYEVLNNPTAPQVSQIPQSQAPQTPAVPADPSQPAPQTKGNITRSTQGVPEFIALREAVLKLKELKELDKEGSAPNRELVDINLQVWSAERNHGMEQAEKELLLAQQREIWEKYRREVQQPIQQQEELIKNLEREYVKSERFSRLTQSIINFWKKTQTWGLEKYKEAFKKAFPSYEIDTMGRDNDDWSKLAIITDKATGEAIILPRRLTDWHGHNYGNWFELKEEGSITFPVVRSMQSLAMAVREGDKWICLIKGKVSAAEPPAVSSSLVDNGRGGIDDSTSSSSIPEEKKGGIDLTHMPAAIMRQPGVINPAAGLTPALSREIFSINLNQECREIEKMMAADIAVSDERLRVLMIVCCRSASSSVSLDKMRDYIAYKIRLDEKNCCPTNIALLRMLELLELNQPPEVMINSLASLSIASK